MQQILVLNSTYEPLHVISWKRALCMLFLRKVEVLAEYDREIRSVSFSVPLPSVLRLLSYVKVKRHHHQVLHINPDHSHGIPQLGKASTIPFHHIY